MGREGEIVIGEVIEGEEVGEKGEEFEEKGLRVVLGELMGKVVLEELGEDGVRGIMEGGEEGVDGELVGRMGGIGLKGWGVIGLGGRVGGLGYERGVVRVLKVVGGEIVEEVERVIGKVGVRVVFVVVVD